MTLARPVIALVLALCAPAAAAPLGLWHGPGDRACAGRCPVEWAAAHLSPARRAELAAAMVRPPVRLSVEDGDVCSIMTYHDGARPLADMRGVVALLPHAEPGEGWRMDGWDWIKIDACQNWCARERPGVATTPLFRPATVSSLSVGAPGLGWYGVATGGRHYGGAVLLPGEPAPAPLAPVDPPHPVPPVPLGKSLLFAVTAFAMLALWRRR